MPEQDQRRGVSHKVAQMEATAAQGWRKVMEDFFHHPEDWDWDVMEERAQDCLSDESGETLEAFLELMREARKARAVPNGTADDKFNLKQDGQNVERDSEWLQHRLKVDLRKGMGRVMDNPPYRTAFYMRMARQGVKDISRRFFEDGTSIFNHNYDAGKDIVVLGNKKSGKTYLAAYYILPDDISIGMRCVGNLLLNNDPGTDENGIPYYQYDDTLEGTLIKTCELRLEGLHISRAYDEAQSSHKRTRVASREYQSQKDLITWSRKFGVKTTYILQLATDVPTEVRAFADVVIKKPKVSDPTLVDVTTNGATEFYKGVKGPKARRRELRRLGLPIIKYDTNWTAIFESGIDEKRLWQYIRKNLNVKPSASEPVSRQQFRLIKEYLESERDGPGSMTLTNELRARVYIETKNRLKISGREMARRVGWPEATLRQWEKRLAE